MIREFVYHINRESQLLLESDAGETMDLTNLQHFERRSKPRIICAYPARVTWQDSGGRTFDENTTIDNISASGMHMLLKADLPLRSGLAVLFRFSKTSPLGKGAGALVAIEGSVVRIQKQMDGYFSVAVKIQNHRFL